MSQENLAQSSSSQLEESLSSNVSRSTLSNTDEKVVIVLKPVGNAKILRKTKFYFPKSNNFSHGMY